MEVLGAPGSSIFIGIKVIFIYEYLLLYLCVYEINFILLNHEQ